MTPGSIAPAAQVGIDHTLGFLERFLRPCSIVEIGCGRGVLAAQLAARGYRVVGVDVDTDALASAKRRGIDVHLADILDLEPGALATEPFEAILFTRSLHHVADPERALDRARALLAPQGWILVEDFAHDAADLHGAAWLFDLEALLRREDEAAPRFPEDPLRAWREQHPADHLQGLSRLQQAVGAKLPGAGHATVAYLYRYLLDLLPPGQDGGRWAAALLAWETACVARGILPAVGCRWWWQNAEAGS